MKKIFRRAKNAVVSMAKKRYTTKKGGVKLGKVAKDVAWLGSVLNPEQKEFRVFNNPADDDLIDVGQVQGNGNGAKAFDVSCAPAQGNTSITRNGNSIKISKITAKFAVFQQTNTAQDIKGKIVFLTPRIPVSDPTTCITNYWEPTPFLNADIQDYSSQWNSDYRKQFKVLGTKYFRLKNDALSTQENSLTFSKTITLKNYHTRFALDGSQALTEGQIIMVILVDSGNSANSTASTVKNIMPSGGGVQTGLTFNYNILYKFYDN